MVLAQIDPIYGVVIVALLGPVGAYLLAARKMSGKIGTSDAEQLWKESSAIREWSRNRIEACDREILDLRSALRDALARLTQIEDNNARLSSENARLSQTIQDLSTTAAELRAKVVDLTTQLRKSGEKVVDLKEEAVELKKESNE